MISPFVDYVFFHSIPFRSSSARWLVMSAPRKLSTQQKFQMRTFRDKSPCGLGGQSKSTECHSSTSTDTGIEVIPVNIFRAGSERLDRMIQILRMLWWTFLWHPFIFSHLGFLIRSHLPTLTATLPHIDWHQCCFTQNWQMNQRKWWYLDHHIRVVCCCVLDKFIHPQSLIGSIVVAVRRNRLERHSSNFTSISSRVCTIGFRSCPTFACWRKTYPILQSMRSGMSLTALLRVDS